MGILAKTEFQLPANPKRIEEAGVLKTFDKLLQDRDRWQTLT